MTATEPEITPDLIAAHGLKPDEYERILGLIGRPPSFTELGIFSAMWNEHCSYKSSKVWLATLPTKAPWVIQGPGENAGVIDIGDGLAVVFKMESHNHPSYIEPYQGAATGVGGILRDVFTMGARPIACLNALSFGDPQHPGGDTPETPRRGRTSSRNAVATPQACSKCAAEFRPGQWRRQGTELAGSVRQGNGRRVEEGLRQPGVHAAGARPLQRARRRSRRRCTEPEVRRVTSRVARRRVVVEDLHSCVDLAGMGLAGI